MNAPKAKTKQSAAIPIGRKKAFPFFLKETLTEKESNHHVHIVGASGFGKSVLISHLLRESILRGKGLLFLDLKADIETLSDIRRFAKAANREGSLKIFSLANIKESESYNPLASGNATQIRDRIISSLTWSEEYYKNVASSFLLKLLIILCWLRTHKKKVFTLKTITACSESSDGVSDLIQEIPEEAKVERELGLKLFEFMQMRDSVSSLQGLRSQLESLTLSEFGSLLTSDAESQLSLFEAVQNKQIIYLVLDSRSYGETAKSLAKFILSDLRATSAKIDSEVRRESRVPFQVVIDEFADIATEDFISFLDRARSSKMSIVVAHQELSDLKRVSPEFAARLMGNMATLYAFLQKNKESAELISSSAGTREVRKETSAEEGWGIFKKPTGAVSVRMVEEFYVHPNVIKGLKVGECVSVKKYPYSRSAVVRVLPPR